MLHRVVISIGMAFLVVTIWLMSQKDDANALQVDSQFEIVGQVYVYGVASDLNQRRVDIQTICPLHLSGPEIVSKRVIAHGSKVRILARKPKQWPSILSDFLVGQEYFVEIDTLPKPAIAPIVFALSRGNEDKLKPMELNRLIYKPF